jgi:hypothetical protein
MNASRVCEDINHPRRRFIGAAAMTVAAAQLGVPQGLYAKPLYRGHMGNSGL